MHRGTGVADPASPPALHVLPGLESASDPCPRLGFWPAHRATFPGRNESPVSPAPPPAASRLLGPDFKIYISIKSVFLRGTSLSPNPSRIADDCRVRVGLWVAGKQTFTKVRLGRGTTFRAY